MTDKIDLKSILKRRMAERLLVVAHGSLGRYQDQLFMEQSRK